MHLYAVRIFIIAFLFYFFTQPLLWARTCSSHLSLQSHGLRDFEDTWQKYFFKKASQPHLTQHLTAAKNRLNELGVEHIIEGQRLVILPTEASELNRFAQRLYQRFETFAFYNPKDLVKFGCEACVEYNLKDLSMSFLNLSSSAIKTGRLTSAEFHEWRHVVEVTKMTRDRQTPGLAGDFTLKAKNRKEADLRISMEEYWAYYTDTSSVLGLYRKGQLSRLEALARMKSNLDFLREHTLDALVLMPMALKTVDNTFSVRNAQKLFHNLQFDPAAQVLFKGGVGFFFVPAGEGKYRVRLSLENPVFDYSLVLKDPKEIREPLSVYVENQKMSEWLEMGFAAHKQVVNTYFAVNEIYSILEQRPKSIKGYQEFLTQYRQVLQNYK